MVVPDSSLALFLVDFLVLSLSIIILSDLFYQSRKPYFFVLIFALGYLILATFSYVLFLQQNMSIFYSLWVIFSTSGPYLIIMGIKIFFLQEHNSHYNYLIRSLILLGVLLGIHFLVGSGIVLLICSFVTPGALLWTIITIKRKNILFKQLGFHNYLLTYLTLFFCLGYVMYILIELVILQELSIIPIIFFS